MVSRSQRVMMPSLSLLEDGDLVVGKMTYKGVANITLDRQSGGGLGRISFFS